MTIGAPYHEIQIALIPERQVRTVGGLQGEALQVHVSNTCFLQLLVDCAEFDKLVLKTSLVICIVLIKAP
jgi:hypothetical protein